MSNRTGRDADPRRTIPLNSSRWRKLRATVLKREPICRSCRQIGRFNPATDVDHVSGDPSDNSTANLQALCHECHSHKTGRERAGLAVVAGCDTDGLPRGHDHHWRKSPATDELQTDLPLLLKC